MTWDTIKRRQKANKKQMNKDPVLRLGRLINFGMGKEKTERKLLAKYIDKLKISENRLALLELLLWNKKF